MGDNSDVTYIYFFVASTIVAGEGVLHDPTLLKEKGVLQTSRHSVNLPPSNLELLTVRGVDRRAFLKMFWAKITV